MAALNDSSTTVRLEPHGDVAVIVLNRPLALNAMSGVVQQGLLAALADIQAGPWRAVVLRGEGRAFCAGADLRSFVDDTDADDPAAVRAYMDAWAAVVAGFRELQVPVVAAVHGVAYGGGWSLALAADLIVAARSARFCMSYIDIGMPADMGASYWLPRMTGVMTARRLLLTGEVIDADEALRLGLVVAVVDDDELVPGALALAERLAAKAPRAMRGMRALLTRNAGATLPEALRNEGDAIAATADDPAFRAALAKFRGGA